MNCFKCLKDLPSALGDDDDSKAPSRGLIFTASGNYGSRIYDPTMSAPQLVVWICDDCIVKHKELVEVRSYTFVQTQVVWKDFDPERAYW